MYGESTRRYAWVLVNRRGIQQCAKKKSGKEKTGQLNGINKWFSNNRLANIWRGKICMQHVCLLRDMNANSCVLCLQWHFKGHLQLRVLDSRKNWCCRKQNHFFNQFFAVLERKSYLLCKHLCDDNALLALSLLCKWTLKETESTGCDQMKMLLVTDESEFRAARVSVRCTFE